MLSDGDKKRIIQLLGMMGSDYDGEVCNAARLAHSLIRSQKLTWDEIFNPSGKSGAANRAAGGRGEGYDQGYEDGLNRGAELARAALAQEYSRGFTDGVNNAKDLGLRATRSWKDWAAARVREDEEYLSQWELNFFGDFSAGRYAVPSAKQRAIFERVSIRLEIELPERD